MGRKNIKAALMSDDLGPAAIRKRMMIGYERILAILFFGNSLQMLTKIPRCMPERARIWLQPQFFAFSFSGKSSSSLRPRRSCRLSIELGSSDSLILSRAHSMMVSLKVLKLLLPRTCTLSHMKRSSENLPSKRTLNPALINDFPL